MPRPLKVLFFAAMPDGTAKMQLGREVAGIQDALKVAGLERRVALQTVWAATPEKLRSALLSDRPDVVHYSGHGQPEGLLLEDAVGHTALVSVEALAALFGALTSRVRLVFLNACDGLQAAKAIEPHVECALGMSDPVGDKAAVAFAGAFYQALALGQSVASSVELGRAAIKLKNLAGADNAQLLARDGVDPTTLTLCPPHPVTPPNDDVQWKPWQPPTSWPARPYPLLARYEDERLFGGREAEVKALCADLTYGPGIVGLRADSGVGKSSLIWAGVRPRLGVHHPFACVTADALKFGDPAGVLLAALLEPPPPGGFVEGLRLAEALSGRRPILCIDQFEELFGHPHLEPVRGLIEASAHVVTWLLAYRLDFHGKVEDWVELPGRPNLRQQFHFRSASLRPLGCEHPEAFREAILQPLNRGAPWAWSMAAADADRLSAAFKKARVADPDAPLVPQLQVVLNSLMDQPGPIKVPENIEEHIDRALVDHVSRVLDRAVPARTGAARLEHRGRLLVALDSLVEGGRRGPPRPAEELAALIGPGGSDVLNKLAGQEARVVVFGEDGGVRLSHDRLADAVSRLSAETPAKVAELAAFITRRVGLHQRGDDASTALGWGRYWSIRRAAELLQGEARQRWWQACRRRWRRFWGTVGVGVLVAGGLAWGFNQAWEASRRADGLKRALWVAPDQPEAAWRASCEAVDEGWLTAEEAADQWLTHAKLAPEWLSWRRVCGAQPAILVAVLAQVLGPQSKVPRSTLTIDLAGAAIGAAEELMEDPSQAARAAQVRGAWVGYLRSQAAGPPPAVQWVRVNGGTLEACGVEACGVERAQSVEVPSFDLADSEVTCEDFRRLDGSHYCPGVRPPALVNWYRAVAFAAWAGGRLPTAIEWEFAALRVLKEEEPNLDLVEVNMPNLLRIYGMVGGGWEWAFDRDPDPTLRNSERVLMGRLPETRMALPPGEGSGGIGFRLARSVPPDVPPKP